MGYRNSWRLRKFYYEQISAIENLLRKYIKEPKINIDTYLKICEQTGEEPDPNKMPVDVSELPLEVQLAFLLMSYLSDKWDGMSGSYLGKDWSSLEYLFKLYEVENQKEVFKFMKIIEAFQVEVSIEKAKKDRKKLEAGGNAKGKGHTYKVGG